MAGDRRILSLSRSGRFVAHRVADGIDLIDALGTAPRARIAQTGDATDFACVGEQLWVLPASAHTIERYLLASGRAIAPAIPLAPGARRILRSAGANAVTALVTGDPDRVVSAVGDQVSELVVEPHGQLFPLTGRHYLAVAADLRVLEASRGELARLAVLEKSQPLAAASLFGGRAIALMIRNARGTQLIVFDPRLVPLHQIGIPEPRTWAIAEQRGIAVVIGDDDELIAIDLRYGRFLDRCETPARIEDIEIDADGQFAAFLTAPDQIEDASPLVHMPFAELMKAAKRALIAAAAAREREADRDDDLDHADDANGAAPGDAEEPVTDAAPPIAPAPIVHTPTADAADAPALLDEPAPPPPPIVVPDLVPRALGADLPPLRIPAPQDAPPYQLAREHVDDLVHVIELRAARAIAEAWNTGQLSRPSEDHRPFEREVLALLGWTGGYATDLLADAEQRLAEHAKRTAARAAATIAGGTPLPYVELAREMALSPTATQILLVVVAPLIRGEIARLYGVLANDEHRPLVDRFLVEVLIAAGDPRLRAEVAGELAPDAPLIRYGLVRLAGDSPLFAELSADPVLVDRIRGREPGNVAGATILRDADRGFAELRIADEIKRELVLALAEPRSLAAPLRLVVRGRRGAGRHAVIAALASRVGRRIAAIDAHRLPRAAPQLAAALRIELSRALLCRAIPVVSGLETIEPGGDGQEAIIEVVRAHPGPLVLRASPEGSLPIEPGYLSIKLPPMSESERTQFWIDALDRAQLRVADPGDLAQRFRIGPGVIERVIREAFARRDARWGESAGSAGREGTGTSPPEGAAPRSAPSADAGAALVATATQHIATRLAHVATHVTRLARWEQVAFPDDIVDSLKELIGRVRHRRTVYERWGFDAKMTTSRGLSALFYGPPGTGKSMVAGLVARELGLELYRVDLSRVVSKWIGETEKNLAEVFDAAEDGQVVILFDEADSLFARRTEVKTSVDRYANLEVNYLLQRLDSFEGICILTTNLEGSIDPAFKRRMSLRLHFPFPDEEMRARLWAAHLPPETPTVGDFDFAELAHRFPLSGGYIRNSAVRAAFLAAQEQRPLSQSYLIRAIQLEYRELGKLSASGRME